MSSRTTINASLPVLAGALVLLSSATHAAEKITYEDHIFPIFEQSCLNCHNPDKQKGGLDLSNYSGTIAGGSGGKIAEPGDGGSSTIFASVTHTGENKMPPKGDKIDKAQAELIRAWVDGGLLETKDSTAKKVGKPKINLAVQIDPNAKPDGPPPMPEHLSLEPVVVGLRSSAIAEMAASPWAPILAVTGQKQVLLYNTGNLQLAAVLPFDAGQPETLSFHPSGKYLLAGGGVPGKSGTTITWDITTGKEVMRNGKAFDSVLGASLRLDLGAVATGGPSRLIKIWDTQTGGEAKSIKKHTDWITSLAYSPDGVLLATADRNGGAWIWEAESGNEFHTLRGHQLGINVLRWRSDSNLLATSSEDGQVLFWEMNTGGQVKKINAHEGGVLAFDFARDGRFLTSGRDRKVKIWKADFTLDRELPTFRDLVVEVTFSHDGKRFFTADWNGAITAWDATTFAKIGQIDANPPHIADRLASLEKALGTIPAELAAARAKVTAAENAVTAAKTAHQTAVQKHTEAKQRNERLTRENEDLQQEWNQLDGRRNEITAAREQHNGALAQSQNQTAELQQQLTAAGNALKQSEPEWNKIEERRGQITERRPLVAAALEALKSEIPTLEQAIAPVQELVAAKEKELPPPKAELDLLQAKETGLKADLAFWTAAAVNHEALQAAARLHELSQ